MTTDEDFEIWAKALEKAKNEATHESEIEARALVYYREMKHHDAAKDALDPVNQAKHAEGQWLEDQDQ